MNEVSPGRSIIMRCHQRKVLKIKWRDIWWMRKLGAREWSDFWRSHRSSWWNCHQNPRWFSARPEPMSCPLAPGPHPLLRCQRRALWVYCPASPWESPQGSPGCPWPPFSHIPQASFGVFQALGLQLQAGEPLKANHKQQMGKLTLKQFHFPNFIVVAMIWAVGSGIPNAPSIAPCENPEELGPWHFQVHWTQEPSLLSPQCWVLIQAPCPGEGALQAPRTIQPAQESSVLWAEMSTGEQNRAFTFLASLCSVSSPSPHLLPSGRPFSFFF